MRCVAPSLEIGGLGPCTCRLDSGFGAKKEHSVILLSGYERAGTQTVRDSNLPGEQLMYSCVANVPAGVLAIGANAWVDQAVSHQAAGAPGFQGSRHMDAEIGLWYREPQHLNSL